MPRSSWLSSHGSSSHIPGLSSLTSGSSTPGSSNSHNAANVPLPSTPYGEHDGYFPSSSTSASLTDTGPYHGIHSVHGSSWLEIVLDQEHVILRGAGGDTNPASLSGRVVLHLAEACNIKEITLTLTGKAKVGFAESNSTSSRSHQHTHLVLHHDWTFLSPPVGANGKKPSHAPVHTLKAGVHSFPFQMTIESDTAIPCSLRTFNNDAHIFYKLRAVAHRSGAFSSNFQATKPVSILRNFTAEALEFTQTLEIENSWPLKVAYSLTLPHKAFAAGDNIPIAVKFQPLAKGVNVTSISTVVKEYTLTHIKNSSHPDVRVAASIKHDIRNGKAYVHKDKHAIPDRPPPTPKADVDDSPMGTPSGSGAQTPARAGLVGHNHGLSLSHLADYFHSSNNSSTTSVPSQQERTSADAFAGGVDPATAEPMDAQDAYLAAREEQREVELGDGEIDTMISIPLPVWTTPSHGIHPCFVTHKIKWSCVISNPDGHTSELRCALPIHVLAPALAEEARIASASTRALLFSLSGDAQEEVQQLELPSYSNHVYDRVANASVAQVSGTAAASWSRNGSPASTPPSSRPGSRPGSPVFGMRGLPGPSGTHHDEHQVPERPKLNWADSELLLSLGDSFQANNSGPHSGPHSPQGTPPGSRPPSRPSSRSGFRSSRSRPGSRASSPERGSSGNNSGSNTPPNGASEGGSSRPGADRRGSLGLFHIPKPMKAFTSLSSHQHKSQKSHDSANGSNGGSSLLYPNHQPLVPPNQHNGSGGNSASYSPHSHSPTSSTEPSRTASTADVAALSQVPSYNIASRGFLGGGVVPLSAVQGLPDYDESETYQRTKSEGNLLTLLNRAAAIAPGNAAVREAAQQAQALPNSASSSALASALSSTAPGGTRAMTEKPPPVPAAGQTSGDQYQPAQADDDDMEDLEDDFDTLQIRTKKNRKARSESVSTVKAV